LRGGGPGRGRKKKRNVGRVYSRTSIGKKKGSQDKRGRRRGKKKGLEKAYKLRREDSTKGLDGGGKPREPLLNLLRLEKKKLKKGGKAREERGNGAKKEGKKGE